MATHDAWAALVLGGLGGLLLSACGSDKLFPVPSYAPADCTSGAYCNPPVALDGGLREPDGGLVLDAASSVVDAATPSPDAGRGDSQILDASAIVDSGPSAFNFSGSYITHYKVQFDGPLAGINSLINALRGALVGQVSTGNPRVDAVLGPLLAQLLSSALPPATLTADLGLLSALAERGTPLEIYGLMIVAGAPGALFVHESLARVVTPAGLDVGLDNGGNFTAAAQPIPGGAIFFSSRGATLSLGNLLQDLLVNIIGAIQCSFIGQQVTRMTGDPNAGSEAQTWCTTVFGATLITELLNQNPDYNYDQAAVALSINGSNQADVLQGIGLPIGNTVNGDFQGTWVGCRVGVTTPGVCPP